MSDRPAGALAHARELVRRWWRLELVLTDAQGQVAEHQAAAVAPVALPVVPAPRNDACRLAMQSREGLRRCGASIAFAHEKASARADAAVRHECHLGFLLVARGLGGEGGSAVLCGLRDRPLGGRELDGARDRLAEIRPHGVPELGPVPAHALDEVERATDFVHVAAEVAREDRDRASVPPVRGRGARRATEQAPPLVGRSLAMLEVQKLLERVCRSDSTVLVQGESGTGKELVARYIHEHGARRDRPFVAQNCSALNDNLLESALFGHVRGSFTGATRDARGIFELADGGTLLLDELGDMSPALQVKLLRVLQEGTFTPVGGAEERRADVRVVAATHKDLGELVRRGLFREDLYYRINVIRLDVPPLREREDDVLLLAAHFLARLSRTEPPPVLSDAVRATFLRYRWPGNVRELQNEVERMVVLGAGTRELGPELVSPRIAQAATEERPETPAFEAGEALPKLHEAVERLERTLLAESLRRNGGNKSKVARELGVARSNLLLKLDRYGLR